MKNRSKKLRKIVVDGIEYQWLARAVVNFYDDSVVDVKVFRGKECVIKHEFDSHNTVSSKQIAELIKSRKEKYLS